MLCRSFSAHSSAPACQEQLVLEPVTFLVALVILMTLLYIISVFLDSPLSHSENKRF